MAPYGSSTVCIPFVVCILFMRISLASSQHLPVNVDSLQTLVQTEKVDTLRIRHHFALYEALKSTDPEQAKKILETGTALGQQGRHKDLYLKGLELTGFYWLDRGIADSAMAVVQQAFEIGNIPGRLHASFLLIEGRALDGKGQYDAAVEKLLESLKVAESAHDEQGVAEVYGNIGNVFWRMENLDKAAQYYTLGLRAYQKIGNRVQSAHLLANLGIIAKSRGEYEKALDAYNQSLALNREIGNKLDESIDLMNIGVLFMDTDRLDSARKYLTRSEALSKAINDKVIVALSTINLAVVEEKSGNYIHELKLLSIARKLAEELQYKPALKEIFNSYSIAYGGLGDYKSALEYRKLYEAWKDSIYDENYTNKISELEVKYESEKKQNEILTLSEENLRKEAALMRKDSWIRILTTGVLIILIIAVLSVIILRQRARYARQQVLFHAVTQAEVTERQRIASDLHDSIGSMLAVVSNELLSVTEMPAEKMDPALLKKSTAMIAQTAEEVRRIAHHMMPEELTRFGLISALESLVQSIQSLKLQSEFIHYGMTERIEPAKEVHIYRIVQELVQNVSKHAQAKSLLLNLTRQDHHLNIMIQDDGVGFDKSKSQKGMGLKSIQSRLEYLKGKLFIDSYPGEGSTVVLDIPLN